MVTVNIENFGSGLQFGNKASFRGAFCSIAGLPPNARRWTRCSGILVLLLACSIAAFAEYRFRVPDNRCTVTANADASVSLAYAITFANEGQPIDIVDVGLPDGGYDGASLRADLGGVPVTDIRNSEVLASGVEVHLGDRAIPAGGTGTLHLQVTCPNRVFPDEKDGQYASLVFSPTWYGAEFTSGTTHLVCEFVFPEGVKPEEPRYHELPFTSSRVEGGRVIYTWDLPEASPSTQYTFGASFPRGVLQRIAELPEAPGPGSRFLGSLASLIGNSVPCLFFASFLGAIAFAIVKGYRRKLKYLKPSVGMEGVEVRRGLTVPEVAVLMEEKVDKVMALLLFGMIRKGLVEVRSRNPLRLSLVPGKEPEFSYEKEFAKAVEDDGRIKEKEAALILSDLIKRVEEKMKGFGRGKTLRYYKEIMRKAWDQVGSENYSQAFEWLLLDRQFDAGAAARFPDGRVPVPIWWPSTYGSHAGGEGGPAAPGTASPTSAAHSIASGIEGFSHDLVNSVPGLATRVTQQTNPVPASSGGHSGGGCACACACAGCACACAGGGR